MKDENNQANEENVNEAISKISGFQDFLATEVDGFTMNELITGCHKSYYFQENADADENDYFQEFGHLDGLFET